MKETGATGVSIVTAILHFAAQIEPLLNLIVALISIVSGSLALTWWVRKLGGKDKK